jgi:hypothetical protein
MLFALTSIERIDQADAASVPPLGSCQEVHDCTGARAPREPCRIRDSAVLYSRGRVRSSRSLHYNLSLRTLATPLEIDSSVPWRQIFRFLNMTNLAFIWKHLGRQRRCYWLVTDLRCVGSPTATILLESRGTGNSEAQLQVSCCWMHGCPTGRQAT